MVGQETETEGKLSYNGRTAQILTLRGCTVKVMVRKGKMKPHITEKSEGGVVGLPRDLSKDIFRLHMGDNLSQKRAKVGTAEELMMLAMDQVAATTMTRRLVVSQIYAIHDLLMTHDSYDNPLRQITVGTRNWTMTSARRPGESCWR